MRGNGDIITVLVGAAVAMIALLVFSYHMMPPFPACGEIITKTQERLQ